LPILGGHPKKYLCRWLREFRLQWPTGREPEKGGITEEIQCSRRGQHSRDMVAIGCRYRSRKNNSLSERWDNENKKKANMRETERPRGCFQAITTEGENHGLCKNKEKGLTQYSKSSGGMEKISEYSSRSHLQKGYMRFGDAKGKVSGGTTRRR